MRKRIFPIGLILVFCVGLSLLLYPAVSNWWNTYHQTRVVAGYAEAVSQINAETHREIWDRAVSYNAGLAAAGGGGAELTPEQMVDYQSQLHVTKTGVMGYISIEKLRCTLPICHGTDENVLQVAIGHIPGTSLPVGGASTHCVLSGHRGLPSARLFTDIDRLKIGDTFTIHTLNEVLTYQVDQIRTVLPDETKDLCVVPGEDLCTLVTCTPYGVNTHRLLVRGHRIETAPDAPEAAAIAAPIGPGVLLAAVLLLALAALVLGTVLRRRRKNQRSVADRHGRN